MKKINLAMVLYGGISNRAMIDIAIGLDKTLFNVFYFWCQPGRELFSTFEHKKESESEVNFQIDKMVKAGVNPIEFKVKKRFIPDPIMPWIDTDFFDKYSLVPIDCVFAWRAGRAEYPYTHLNTPVVEWNIFGMADSSHNLMKSLAISPLCKDLYVKNGGDSKKIIVQYIPVQLSNESAQLRGQLSIPDNAVICGMHQRPERGIFSPISINAVLTASKAVKKNVYFLMLGGSERYSEHAKLVGLKNFIQLPYESDPKNIDIFLNTLDIYTHARSDGETLGRVLQEAMIHKLPIVSHTAQWNAHIETIGSGGYVANNEKEYADVLLTWINNMEQAKKVGMSGFEEANKKYTNASAIEVIQNQIIDAITEWKIIGGNNQKMTFEILKGVNYFYLIRFFGIQFYNRSMTFMFGVRGSNIVLSTQQLFNRIKRLFRISL
jgi:glycosyltransferase involved in cell wall biosynthesis